MDALNSLQVATRATGTLTPASSTVRRILVVTDPKGTDGYGPEKQLFHEHLQGFVVDHWDLDTLALGNSASAPILTQLTSGRDGDDCLNTFSMLSGYQLILVPNERVRATLCEVMPGLSHHVYALDRFEEASEELSPDGSLERTRSQDAGLALWTAFLSHLAS